MIGLANPAQRRKTLTMIGGILIVLALVSEHLLAMPADLLLFIAALVCGADIALRAWNALRNRHISIELLVTIAAIGALLIGEYWEAAVVTFLFMFGAYLEARTMSRTRQALGELLDLAPTGAIVLRHGQQVEVSASEVELDEVVIVKAGTKVPVDGEVVDGHAAVDESMITGESIPVEKTLGTKVYAGTVSQNGLLRIRATGIGADTTLARIVQRVEEAQEEKAPTQRFIERFAHWYTPSIIGLSAVAYLITRDLSLALTLLVIGCPGALVISTPVSVIAGIGQAAKRGILIKGGEYLERAGKISAVAFDKTGTLTRRKPQLTDIIALQPALAGVSYDGGYLAEQSSQSSANRWDIDQLEVLRWAAIAEAGSEHPLAKPILAEASLLEIVPHADAFDMSAGRGVKAVYQGHTIVVGNWDWLTAQDVDLPTDADESLSLLKAEGKTAVLVGLDGRTLGVLGISDTPRETAQTAIRQLKAIGIKRIVMLTGDDPRTAQAIAAHVGIEEVHAGLLPEHKLQVIRQLQEEGHVVAMVGDGINDAPALAAADIGMAMGAAGTDVAIETADIALMSDDLLKIAQAVAISKATSRNIRQNVVIALLTVAGLLTGVILREVQMAGGMFIHEISVLIVILNGMRLLRSF